MRPGKYENTTGDMPQLWVWKAGSISLMVSFLTDRKFQNPKKYPRFVPIPGGRANSQAFAKKAVGTANPFIWNWSTAFQIQKWKIPPERKRQYARLWSIKLFCSRRRIAKIKLCKETVWIRADLLPQIFESLNWRWTIGIAPGVAKGEDGEGDSKEKHHDQPHRLGKLHCPQNILAGKFEPWFFEEYRVSKNWHLLNWVANWISPAWQPVSKNCFVWKIWSHCIHFCYDFWAENGLLRGSELGLK